MDKAHGREKNTRGVAGITGGTAGRRVLAGAVLLMAAGILQVTARRVSGFGEWYATAVYPWIVGIYGRVCGLFPFSVSEIVLYLGILWLVWYIVSRIRKIWRARRGTGERVSLRRMAAGAFSGLFLFAGLLAFLYTACCGVNYYRRPFSSYLNLEVRDSSVDELRALCEYLTQMVNETVDTTPYSSSWEKDGQRAMDKLAEQYPQLAGHYPRPKGLRVSWILSVQQLSGIYSPFTVEANYNREMTDYDIPHTICHELSHLRGFMREDEANFIGYLACIGSDSPYFRYSGYLTGWVYAGNALAAQDIETYSRLYGQLNARSIEDLQANNAFWRRYDGKVAEAATKVNDTYLKINSQQEGVKSYGRMVDLMLAYYR